MTSELLAQDIGMITGQALMVMSALVVGVITLFKLVF